MKIAIMQPYLFPYIGYFQLINAVDKFVIHDDVQYIKGGWINRNRILVDSKEYMFTFSLKKASSFELIKNRQFSSTKDDKEKLLRIIEYAYGKSPFYNDAIAVIKDSLSINTDNVATFIYNTIRKICEYLNIHTEIILSSSIKKDETLKGQKRVLHLCKQLGAVQYINPIGGTSLYMKDEFHEQAVTLNFLETNPIVYKQFNSEFVASLSIIDVIMFNSKVKVRELLTEYNLI